MSEENINKALLNNSGGPGGGGSGGYKGGEGGVAAEMGGGGGKQATVPGSHPARRGRSSGPPQVQLVQCPRCDFKIIFENPAEKLFRCLNPGKPPLSSFFLLLYHTVIVRLVN